MPGWMIAVYVVGVPFAWVAAFRFVLYDDEFGAIAVSSGHRPDNSDRVFGALIATMVCSVWPLSVLPFAFWQTLNLTDHLANLTRLIAPDPPDHEENP